jgi:hypothetical protein
MFPICEPHTSGLGDAEVQALSEAQVRAGRFLERLSREHANLFEHWRVGMLGVFA